MVTPLVTRCIWASRPPLHSLLRAQSLTGSEIKNSCCDVKRKYWGGFYHEHVPFLGFCVVWSNYMLAHNMLDHLQGTTQLRPYDHCPDHAVTSKIDKENN